MSIALLQKKPLLSYKKPKGLGPAYKLPSLTGYEKHDPSRPRNPAFSIRSRHNEKDNITTGPGPNRYNTYHLTRRGPETSPAFSLAGRAKFLALGFGPGPGAYHPEKCPPVNHTKRSPAFSIKSRHERFREKYLISISPGPDTYAVPACLGPKIPHKKTIGAFTITGRKFGKEESTGPGPNAYGNPNYDVIKRKYPAYSLKSRNQLFDQAEGPGPSYNISYIAGKRSPMFSFGMRHSEYKALPIVDMDNESTINIRLIIKSFKKISQQKKNIKNNENTSSFQKSQAYCFYQAPGPIYQLPPVFGYKNHCHTKLRNPAHTIIEKRPEIYSIRYGPGPIYYLKTPKRGEFTTGMPWKPLKLVNGTSESYILPPYRPTPAFSLRSRIKEPPPETIGARSYNLLRDLSGPAFTIGIPFHKVKKIDHGPPPRVINFKWVTPRAPAFTLHFKPPSQGLSSTPGPYNPVDLNKRPAFSIGVKYNPCVFPYITSCDKLC